MEQKLFEDAFMLKELLKSSHEYQELITSEQIMSEDLEVQKLVISFQTALSIYNDHLNRGLATKQHLQALTLKKTTLYTHPYVNDYLNKLKQFNQILSTVYDDIFGQFTFLEPSIFTAFQQQPWDDEI